MLNCQRVYDKELKYWCLMCIYIHRTDTSVNVYNCKCGTQTYARRCMFHTIAHAPAWSLRVCIVTSIWVNYNDLTATSLESWLRREIIPKWPNNSGSWNIIFYPAASMRMSKCTVYKFLFCYAFTSPTYAHVLSPISSGRHGSWCTYSKLMKGTCRNQDSVRISCIYIGIKMRVYIYTNLYIFFSYILIYIYIYIYLQTRI